MVGVACSGLGNQVCQRRTAIELRTTVGMAMSRAHPNLTVCPVWQPSTLCGSTSPCRGIQSERSTESHSATVLCESGGLNNSHRTTAKPTIDRTQTIARFISSPYSLHYVSSQGWFAATLRGPGRSREIGAEAGPSAVAPRPADARGVRAKLPV